MFTTRPEILGTFGVVASTHWIASAVGMSILERGGNAFDAARRDGVRAADRRAASVRAGRRRAGDHLTARTGRTEVLCGQGVGARGRDASSNTRRGLDLVPGSGLLATVVPGAFDAWMLLLRDHGRWPLARRAGAGDRLRRARAPGAAARRATSIAARARVLRRRTGRPPPRPGCRAGARRSRGSCSQPGAGRHLRAHPRRGRGGRRRPRPQIEAARAAFMKGFVAEAIDRFCRTTEVMDASGQRAIAACSPPTTWRSGGHATSAADLRLS